MSSWNIFPNGLDFRRPALIAEAEKGIDISGLVGSLLSSFDQQEIDHMLEPIRSQFLKEQDMSHHAFNVSVMAILSELVPLATHRDFDAMDEQAKQSEVNEVLSRIRRLDQHVQESLHQHQLAYYRQCAEAVADYLELP